MSDLTIIVAASMNNVIGINNELPWRIKEDLQRFKSLTMGHPIIMGRKTYESIGNPLPGRENIVLTSDSSYNSEGITVYSSFDDIQKAIHGQDAFVIGGSQVYRLAIDVANKIELTLVHKVIPGDSFFPKIDREIWQETNRQFKGEYSFISYIRQLN